MSTLVETIKTIAKTFDRFTERGGGIKMRPYQLEPAQAIYESITTHAGRTIVIIISRQAGKDELLANLVTYLLRMFSHREAGIVYVNPTYKPQTINAMMRLENRLKTNLLTRSTWKKRADFMRMIDTCTVSYLSGDKNANVVGAVASLLLIVNEAQDITPAKYDKDFAPMVASTNATRVIVGTEWTNNTLLAREEDAARQAEQQDGIRRLFKYTSADVRKSVPQYGEFVDGEIKKLGREHPLIKTQYFCERIDSQAGMFNARRLALMQGDQPGHDLPSKSERIPSHIYAMLIDVAGQDEAVLQLEGDRNPGRDKTTLDIVDIDLLDLDLLQKPIYRVIKRLEWQGDNHVQIFGAITALVDAWQPLYIVIDATGAGEGLTGMLATKYPSRLKPFKFTAASKSELGYGYIAIIESGRLRDCAPTEAVRIQYEHCQSEILIGPAKLMRWGVPDGTRDKNGLLIHDDYITADALTAGAPFLTIQKAIDVVAALDCSIFNVTIQLADGTYTTPIIAKSFLGSGVVTIQGNAANPSLVTINPIAATAFLATGVLGKYILKDFRNMTISSGACLVASQNSILEFSNLNFGACPSDHMQCSTGASITATGDYFVSGGAYRHIVPYINGLIDLHGRRLTYSNNPAFSLYNFGAEDLSEAYVYAMTFINGSTATGKRYSASGNGVINTNAGGLYYVPGSILGTTATGGQYL